jgi:hypothetical protein
MFYLKGIEYVHSYTVLAQRSTPPAPAEPEIFVEAELPREEIE